MRKLLLLLGILLPLTMLSQDNKTENHNWCGSHDLLYKQTNKNTTFANNINLLEDPSIGYTGESRKIIIPVVIHVVYKDSSQIPSMEDLTAQIKGLNDDFNADNWDVVNVDDAFEKLVADTKISFKLATVNPKGNKTNGITYTQTEEEYFTIYDDVKTVFTGGKSNWDSKRYLNVWICNLSNLRGYAQFPGGNKHTDGIVIDYRDIGIYEEYFNSDSTEHFTITNRVLTHEVGHWLGLRHIWGDSFCGDDKIKDTPTQMQPHWFCGESESCGSVDLCNNYMDYNGFECMVMFTKDQRRKMWKTLSLFRRELLKKSNKKLTD